MVVLSSVVDVTDLLKVSVSKEKWDMFGFLCPPMLDQTWLREKEQDSLLSL